MLDGKKFSRIVEAIAKAEKRTSGEIRVHISKRWIERDPLARARKIFHKVGMSEIDDQHCVLLYVNLRRRKLAVYGNEQVYQKLGQKFWDRTTRELAQDLRGTHHENAIALAVEKIGDALALNFPDPFSRTQKDHSNEVTSD